MAVLKFLFETHSLQSTRMAERAGFEPAVPCGTQHFQCCTIGHSVTSPKYRNEHLQMYQDSYPVNVQKNLGF